MYTRSTALLDRPISKVLLAFLAIGLASVTVHAAINLEWRAEQQTAVVGDIVEVGLYAVYEAGSPEYGQHVGGVDVLLEWDASKLELLGNINNGPYAWMSSSFPPEPYGINTSWTDGDAFYIAYAPLGSGNYAVATPEGLLVTTVQFRALAGTEESQLSIPGQIGAADTVIYTDVQGSGNGLGTCGSATFTIEHALGDMNCDGSVNALDIDPFTLAMTDPDAYATAYPDCDITNADINGDSMVNSLDIDPFIERLD